METYEMTCTCGEVMKVDASSQEEATMKMKEILDAKGIKDHWREVHKGDPVPSVKEVYRMIDVELAPAPASA